ncbi:hypothetical protein DTL42_09910 [Bremerella cremea]|uniref:ATP-binding cassette domain-containing protein n=1 Tax=Bremerella cremea TaxID=1031537 RepID=A0A368KS95_9BACT|nr:hypothetical protein [Bremerella cremea]RCS51865.1 hypothetical protein DTL42_09910 [Bremerella cremea]
MMRRNPFSTCFTRPGQIPFHFPAGTAADKCAATFEKLGAQRAIVGPHGSGKSTLLEMLSPKWKELGWREQRVRLTAARKRKSISWGQLDESSILVIDGFEQLSWWQQRWVRARCWQKRARLLVTCHADCGVPILLRTEVNWPLAYELAGMLLGGDVTPYEAELRAIWEEEPGNIRDFFFRLYHWCELRGLYRPEHAKPRCQAFAI